MKVTDQGPIHPLVGVGYYLQQPGPSGQVPTANGSNGVAWGSNVAIITSNGSNALLGPFVNFASGSNIIFTLDQGPLPQQAYPSNTLRIHSTGGSGGSGATINYGDLKPASPDFDFDSALSGWTAHSVSGSFTIDQARAQALDGSHLRIGYKLSQRGLIYRTVGNTDLDIVVGGLRMAAGEPQAHMPGIAVLNSAGTGVGIVQYNDGNCYLANITTWAYASLLQTITGYGHHNNSTNNIGQVAELYLRLQRSGNSWTASLSIDGDAWNVVSSSSSVTITADRFAVGNFLTDVPGVYWLDFVDGI